MGFGGSLQLGQPYVGLLDDHRHCCSLLTTLFERHENGAASANLSLQLEYYIAHEVSASHLVISNGSCSTPVQRQGGWTLRL